MEETAMSITFSLTMVVLGAALTPQPGDEPRSPDRGKSAAVRVENEQGKATLFSPDTIAKLPRHKAKVIGHSGLPATYEGASLVDVLSAAKVTLGKELKGPLLTN